MTYDELQGLTYLQVKGTGLANTCPVVETGEAGSKIPTFYGPSLTTLVIKKEVHYIQHKCTVRPDYG